MSVSLSHDLLKNDRDPSPVSNNISIRICTFSIRLHSVTLILMNNCCLTKVLTTYLLGTITDKVMGETHFYTIHVFSISDKSLKLSSLLMTGNIGLGGGGRIQTKPNAHNRCFIYILNYDRKKCKIHFRFDRNFRRHSVPGQDIP